MSRLIVASFVLLYSVIFSCVLAENVIDLNDGNFDSRLESMDAALVMFYAPWCGHCKKLKPEFEKAAGELLQNDPPVHLVKVDCTEEGKDVCGRFEVSGYPTLKIFRNGEVSSDYNGPREYSGIVKYMSSQVGPSYKTLSSQDEADTFLARRDTVVMCHSCNKESEEAFKKIADSMRETTKFAVFKDSKKSGIFLHRPNHLKTKMEDSEVEFKGKISKDVLKDWIKTNFHGVVGHRTVDNVGDFSDPLVIAYFDVDYVKNVKGTNYWRNRIMKVAKDFSELTFCISNYNDFMQEVMEFGLDAVSSAIPKIVIRNEKGKKFVMSDEFSIDNFKKFLEDYKNGKIEVYLKSEDVPKDNTGPVKVAVAKNFEELVTKSKKDVLIEFYAPWCGHCKSLMPIYEDLGKAMENENVEIVKMDATANDVASEYDVRGFPTLYWLPVGTKVPTRYEGGRALKDFITYIAKNSENELNGYNRKGKEKKAEL